MGDEAPSILLLGNVHSVDGLQQLLHLVWRLVNHGGIQIRVTKSLRF